MLPLCEFAQDKSVGVCLNIICSKTNEFCTMVRYCTIEQKPTMTSNYYQYGCKLKNNTGVNMAKRQKQRPREKKEITFESSDIIKEIICKANYTKHGKTSLQYQQSGNLYNIMVDGEYKDIVRICYKGTFTNKNIISIEQL